MVLYDKKDAKKWNKKGGMMTFSRMLGWCLGEDQETGIRNAGLKCDT